VSEPQPKHPSKGVCSIMSSRLASLFEYTDPNQTKL
jgi:hypothetical protein